MHAFIKPRLLWKRELVGIKRAHSNKAKYSLAYLDMKHSENQSRVLIVDDEPLARDTLEALLYREGYELLFAVNGIDAIQRMKELAPDVILLDVMMPQMTGYESVNI